MGEIFKSNNYLRPTYKHIELPIYMTDEFDFFRCVKFEDTFYGKTVSELHAGNLRKSDDNSRYAKLFKNQKISYWANSPNAARAEIKKHGSGNDIITFWAYDDVSSTIPITGNEEKLTIVDGRKCGIQELIDKIDKGKNISSAEEELMNKILAQDPDCLAYDSKAYPGGENFIFLEKGFKKLAIRELRLRLGSRSAKNTQTIVCAGTSDYMPYVEYYGCFFSPIARVGFNNDYLKSTEYNFYEKNYDKWMALLCSAFSEKTSRKK